MFLTDDEVALLTGKLRRDAQARVLNFMGIDHKLRPDGALVVLRSYVERMLGGGDVRKSKRADVFDFSKVR